MTPKAADSTRSTKAQTYQTHERLLAATRELLEEDGFEAFSMEKVAARAGVTRKTVYLHFESRFVLVAELFDYVAQVEGLESSIAPVWAAPDGPAMLEAWAYSLADYHPRILAVSRAMHGIWRSDPATAGHRKKVRASKLAICRRIAQRLSDEGVLAAGWTVATAADVLDALATNDLIEVLTLERGWSRKKLADGLARLFHSTFVAPDARR